MRAKDRPASRLISKAVAVGLFLFAFGSVAAAQAAVIVNRGAPPPRVAKAQGSAVVASPVAARPASDGSFWTRERMLGAEPAGNHPGGALDLPGFGARATTSAATGDFTPGRVNAYPQRIHGKVFTRIGEQVYFCSGTVIDSARRNVVLTAGHCVYDHEAGSFAHEVAFVPAYANGETPYGIFPGTQWLTTSQWVANRANSYDIGVIVLQDRVQRLGARQIAFDLRPRGLEYTVYGYPSKPDPPFDGETLQGCRAAFTGRDGARSGNVAPFPLSANPCFMQQGSSGGGWVTLGNYVSSVVSYGYCDTIPESCGFIFGPHFSNAAKSLYVDPRVGGSPAPRLRLLHAPPRIVRKRRVNFRFAGTSATLLGFSCRLDRRRPVPCSSRISIARLSPGRHTLRVRAVDQTGRYSRGQIVRHFRVIPPRRQARR